MRKHSVGRRRRIETLVLCVVVIATVAPGCSRLPAGPGGPSRSGTGRVFGSQGSTSSAALRRDAYIGEAHNAEIDAFRRELRRAGHVAPDLCGHIGGRSEYAREVLARTPLCAGLVAQVTMRPLPSALASQLLIATERAIDTAAGPAELDERLGSILRASRTLDSTEQFAVTAAVSVARSSFAYWRENLPAFAREVDSEYRPCLERYRRSGRTANHVRRICVRGADTTVAPREAVAPNIVRQAAFAGSRRCSGYDYRAVAKDDARGAFVGALLGAVHGAVAGGSAASIASGIEDTWSMMTCVLAE